MVIVAMLLNCSEAGKLEPRAGGKCGGEVGDEWNIVIYIYKYNKVRDDQDYCDDYDNCNNCDADDKINSMLIFLKATN